MFSALLSLLKPWNTAVRLRVHVKV